ncbi:MAG: hypothetical protein JWP14_1562 [Frankiales bacterium]|nr:hypothetical protein [Frankiales bacterium]
MLRNVQVWQITDPLGDPLPVRFPSARLFRVLDAERRRKRGNLSCFHRDGTETLLEPITSSPRPQFSLHRVRRENLPSEVDPTGNVTDLSIPGPNGLVEATELVFFPRNVVVAVYNHQGPRVRRLAEWLSLRLDTHISLRPVFRSDAIAIIDSMERFTTIELALPAEMAVDLDPADENDVFAALEASARATDGGAARVVLSVGRHRRASARQRLAEQARSLVRRQDLGRFSTARVVGYLPGESDPTMINLVDDQLVLQREIEPISARDRRLSHRSAREACEETFEHHQAQIEATIPPVPAGDFPMPEKPIPVGN